MSQPEQFRDDVYLAEGNQTDLLRGELGAQMDIPPTPGPREPIGRQIPFPDQSAREPLSRDAGRDPMERMAGSPLPAGNPLPGSNPAAGQPNRASAPGRGLAPVPQEDPTSMQRAMGLLKSAAPFVAKLLPLLEGNIANALGNLLAPRLQPPPVQVDLTPVQHQISDLQLKQNDLRSTVQEQTMGLKRVETQLDMVREATDRNTLEQQELMGDLKAMGRKVSLVATGFSILLLLSVIMNVILYLYIRRALP